VLNIREWRIIAVIALVALVIVSTSFAIYLVQDEDEGDLLTVRFLNIGHGLSILITTPDDKNILIDAGSFDNIKSTGDFLEELEVERIDAFIITNPHPDHVSFAVDVLQRYDVLEIFMPGNADNLDPEGWSAVMNATVAEGCPVHNDTTINPGDYIHLSDVVTFQVMWIDANATLINNSCIVLRMDYKDTSFLFTGDIEFAAEAAMMDLGLDLDVDILQVAHHGVDTGTTSEFLNVSMPEVAIISCGIGYGIPQVPQPGVLARLEGVPIYTTMYNSMVIVEVDKDYMVSYS
jgi:competence protein ComEC